MADKPIIFSGPMVRALLAGEKTQTRRLAKFVEPGGEGQWHAHGRGGGWYGPEARVPEVAPDYAPYDVGDRLYVRESIYFWSAGHDGEITYAANGSARQTGPNTGEIPDDALAGYFRMVDRSRECLGRISRPSIHMPRWASRITLDVSDVRVQRLSDISDADALAEGIETTEYWREEHPPSICFSVLWESLHGKGSWEANPWVVALTFDVKLGNIDSLSAHHNREDRRRG